MKINQAIKLMKTLDNISIEQLNENRYTIALKEYDEDFKRVVCIIDNNQIEYCLVDLYNNSCNYEAIDLDQLKQLQEFVKILQNI